MTKSEKLFEGFLEKNNIFFEKISVTKEPTSDYLLNFNDYKITVEIKEIREDENFKTGQFSVSSRKVGDHVRAKISEAKKQIQQANKANLPAVLLIPLVPKLLLGNAFALKAPLSNMADRRRRCWG